MKKTMRYIVSIIIVCIFVVSGILLPERISSYSDRNVIEKYQSEFIEPMEINSYEDISMLDKINLLENSDNTVNILLKTGTNFTIASISSNLSNEIEKLESLNLLPNIEQNELSNLKIDARLYVNRSEPSTNAILWTITASNEEFSGTFYIDDATGKIIKLSIFYYSEIEIVDENIVDIWANYLGLEVREVDIHSPTMSKSMDRKILSKVYVFEFISEKKNLSYIINIYADGYQFGN